MLDTTQMCLFFFGDVAAGAFGVALSALDCFLAVCILLRL